MKRSPRFLFIVCVYASASALSAQTLYVPGGTGAIGSSTQAGNVGIGTSAPATALDVVGAISATGNLRLNNNSYVYGKTPTGTYQAMIGGNGSYNLAIGDGAGWGNIVFYPGAGEVMRITQSGYVGIGTGAPIANLDIYSNNPQIAPVLVDRGYDGARIQFRYAGYPTPAEIGMTYYGPGSLALWTGVNLSSTGASHVSAPLQAVTSAPSWFTSLSSGNDWFSVNRIPPGGTNTPLLVINGSGNVGIGATTPSQKLEVVGNVAVSTSNAFIAHYSANENYRSNFSWEHLQLGNNGVNYIVAGNTSAGGGLAFVVNNSVDLAGLYGSANNGTTAMWIGPNSNVGIGTTNPTQKLSVNGTVQAKEVIVQTGWSDYVFKSDYCLAPLSEVEGAIKRDGHLPGVPSAAQVAKEGVSIGEMQAKLLTKIEELTLHVIAQEKRIEALEVENAKLRAKP